MNKLFMASYFCNFSERLTNQSQMNVKRQWRWISFIPSTRSIIEIKFTQQNNNDACSRTTLELHCSLYAVHAWLWMKKLIVEHDAANETDIGLPLIIHHRFWWSHGYTWFLGLLFVVTYLNIPFQSNISIKHFNQTQQKIDDTNWNVQIHWIFLHSKLCCSTTFITTVVLLHYQNGRKWNIPMHTVANEVNGNTSSEIDDQVILKTEVQSTSSNLRCDRYLAMHRESLLTR